MEYDNDKIIELLIRAVNNRTRERNYFRLYCQLLEGEITEEEFNKKIDDNEDEYVVSNDNDANITDIFTALNIAAKIKDCDAFEDLVDLFSFKHDTYKKINEINKTEICSNQ